MTVPLHLLFAQFGWYERYQAYLIALGVYVALGLLADLRSPDQVGVSVIGPPADGASRPWMRWWVVPTLVCLLVAFSGNKPSGVVHAAAGWTRPTTSATRWRVPRALLRREPVATGELGYVSLFHEGPVTDIFGLGDRESCWSGSASTTRCPRRVTGGI